MRSKEYRTFCADFETTVYEGQDFTEVWAAALVELNSEEVSVDLSIKDFFKRIDSLLKKSNLKVYFHNLKFDGSFIMDYLLRRKDLKQAGYYEPKNPDHYIFWKDSEMLNNSYKYMISAMGEWYSIIIKRHGHFLMILDSFKLLPFALRKIGKDFKTKHQKTTIEYTGIRHAGYPISPEEEDYIKNDVLVMKEALEIMQERGYTKITIGSCCLSEYQKMVGHYDFHQLFPDLSKQEINPQRYGSKDADEYIRNAYRGGWCYLAKGKENRIYEKGLTLDVNSLYPSVMSGESNNAYPYGNASFWHGNYIPDKVLEGYRKKTRYYFIRVKTRFLLKPGMLPTIQIKHSYLYKGNEYLESSRIKIRGEEFTSVNLNGEEITDRVTLTLTCTDWEIMKEHYYLADCEILDGCYFHALPGIFDIYIKKYQEIKMHSTGSERTLAKLFLNNLYGKLATSRDSSFKVAALDPEKDLVTFKTIEEHDKKLIHIAAGAAVTSYAREFTIKAAQANFYGSDQPGFIYADTDSIHCDLSIDQIRGVTLHDTNFLCWKHESDWNRGIFIRQKTYIEIIDKDINVTACGMGKGAKEDLKNRLNAGMPLQDFKLGLKLNGNLKQKRIPGGVILYEDEFNLR